MKFAYLYIRVSTDEQADRGYSLRDQEERLRKYCEIQGISVLKVISEDYSAKTFDRPAWRSFLIELKKKRRGAGLVLFTKWDRFSRNAGDAYTMINVLRKLGLEPQAVEQPLDLSVPENKMMLAFYLAAPEVENDRRALNTFHGMRRARKEGRYMGGAPTGYRNKITESGQKYIAPDESKAWIIRSAFEMLALGKFTTEQVWKECKAKGLNINKKNFWVLIRNPVYCGKIVIPKWKDEEEAVVDGRHEAIISESIFYEVQDVLDGRKKSQRTKIKVDESTPLRGFLICPRCGKMLTSSYSRGKLGARYGYYHCVSSCGSRFPVAKANDLFVEELKRYTIKSAVAELYAHVLCDVYTQRNAHAISEAAKLNKDLAQATKELETARSLILQGVIDGNDFQVMKAGCEGRIARVQAQLSALKSDDFDITVYSHNIAIATSQLDSLFMNRSVEFQRQLVSSIYPENLLFDGERFRTPRLNEVVSLMCSIDAGFGINKKGVQQNNFQLYPEVTLGVHFSNNFRHDVKSLAALGDL